MTGDNREKVFDRPWLWAGRPLAVHLCQ